MPVLYSILQVPVYNTDGQGMMYACTIQYYTSTRIQHRWLGYDVQLYQAAVAQVGERGGCYPLGCWFNHWLLLAQCRGVPERDASPKLLPMSWLSACVYEWVKVRPYCKELWLATGQNSAEMQSITIYNSLFVHTMNILQGGPRLVMGLDILYSLITPSPLVVCTKVRGSIPSVHSLPVGTIEKDVIRGV